MRYLRKIMSFLLILFSELTFSQDSFIVKPYIQIGNTPSSSSLQILWHSKEKEDVWEVQYKIDSEWVRVESISYNKVAVVGVEAHRVYHASLQNLKAGSKFLYKIFKNGNEVFFAHGQTIKSVTQPYQFVVIGDIGAETVEQKRLASTIFYSQPDFVAIPGDIVYNSGLINEYRTKFWPIYNADQVSAAGAPLMRSIPFIAAVGNHDADTRDLDRLPQALAYYLYWDLPLNGPTGKEGGPIVPLLKGSEENKNAFLNAAGKNYPKMTNYSFDYGNAHWTIIDSDTYVDWTDSMLVNWLKNDLEASNKSTWHFVMFHHPGFNSSIDHFEQQQMRLLAPIFETGHVDIVFNGHVHNYQRSFPLKFNPDGRGTQLVDDKINKNPRGRVVPGLWKLDKTYDGEIKTHADGIIYIVTGAGGQDLYNPEQEKDLDSWQKFTYRFKSTTHSLTFVKVNGKKLELHQIDETGNIIDKFILSK